MANNPHISIILATYNRRDVTLDTIQRVHQCGLERNEYEIIVVDNASSDGTAQAIRPYVDRVIELPVNKGSCAKAWGVDAARGRFVVFLDDDSSPRTGSLHKMMAHFDANPTLGAAGFRVHLPDGSEECGALPDVFVGCGVGFRIDAIRQVGGIDRTFFMQAEEYDLAFRLARAGWDVRVFDDLHVDHLKTPQARRHERTTFFDTRNNLRVIARYLPDDARHVYREDALHRYQWIAEREVHMTAFHRGRQEADWHAPLERIRFRKHRLTTDAFEKLFRWSEVEQRTRLLTASGVRRAVFVEFGKNVYAFFRAARLAGIQVSAIGDDRFAAQDRTYRSVPVLPLAQALDQPHDTLVISNMAPVFADRAVAALAGMTSAPVHNWFGRTPNPPDGGFRSTTPHQTSDDTRTEYVLAST